jgi:hypothetical protein
MKLHWVFLILMSTPMYAWQGGTPQAALEEIAGTTRPEVIVQHLPEPVQKRIEALPRAKKQEILDKLLELKSSQLQDCTVRPAQNGDGWEVIDEDGEIKARVKLDNAFISGVDAMLPLRIEADGDSQSFIITMHLEDHEWRIDDFGLWQRKDLGIDQLLHEPTEMENNEAAAIQTIQTIAVALNRYAASNPLVGYPSDLKSLTTGPKNASPRMLGLLGILDESFAADPLIKNGYRFRYLLTQPGDGTAQNSGKFEITAVPVEFGKTGARSFFVNEGGDLRMTRENRSATADDPEIDADAKSIRVMMID